MPSDFSSIAAGREDRILKLALEARQDKEGVNLVAGVPLQPDGSTLVFESIKAARAALPVDNSYGPIAGLPELVQLSEFDIFGSESQRLKNSCITSVITVGGTHALFTAGRLLQKSKYSKSPVYCPTLTWDNHPSIFTNLGFEFIQSIDYQRSASGELDFARFLHGLKQMRPDSILLIQGSGNNPAGFDFTTEQILEIGKICQSNNTVLIYDFAYQQLGTGYNEDCAPIRSLTDTLGLNFIVCYSFSKRYGTFGQRAGMLSVACESPEFAARVKSAIMESNRSSISNPPRYPQELILWVKKNREREHYAEVESLRARSVNERKLFISGMQRRGFDFSYMKNDAGMFIFLSAISADQARQLKEQYHVHGVPWRNSKDEHQGLRLNALGLGEHNRERLMDALAQVL